jgi:hypothetical protein
MPTFIVLVTAGEEYEIEAENEKEAKDQAADMFCKGVDNRIISLDVEMTRRR